MTAGNYLLQVGIIPGSRTCMMNSYKKNPLNKFLNPVPDPDYHQNLIIPSAAHLPPFRGICGKIC